MKWHWLLASHSYTLHATRKPVRIPMDVLAECGRLVYLNPDRHVPGSAKFCEGCAAKTGSTPVLEPAAEPAAVLTGAACARSGYSLDLWAVESSTISSRAMAAHICLNHCPAAAKCLTEARRRPQPGYIMAGLMWPAGTAIEPAHRCDLCPGLDVTWVYAWPVEDMSMTRGELIAEAESELPGLAASAGVEPSGPTSWELKPGHEIAGWREYELVLVATTPGVQHKRVPL